MILSWSEQHMENARFCSEEAAKRMQWANDGPDSLFAHWVDSAGWWYGHAMEEYDAAETWRRAAR